MDDDWFLTTPWQMSDFVAPDGGQMLTGKSHLTTATSAGGPPAGTWWSCSAGQL